MKKLLAIALLLSLSSPAVGQGRGQPFVPSGGAAATKADQQAASSNVLAVTPAVQQNHPSAAKVWAIVTLLARWWPAITPPRRRGQVLEFST